VLALSSAHIAYWNSWYSWYGNTPSGFAKLSSNFEGNFRRSACVLVTVGAGGERPLDPGSPPVDAASLRQHLDELNAAGADNVIALVARCGASGPRIRSRSGISRATSADKTPT